jgi:hypothetical protein
MLGELKTEILKAVAGGKQDFHPEPDDGSDGSRARFQLKARSIIELGRDGYLQDVRPTKESETGQHYIDLVMVGGLTPKGRRSVDSMKLTTTD